MTGLEMLYQLTIVDPERSYDSYQESFRIGLFKSRQEAERIAAFYFSSVEGFCDHLCTYEIITKEVLGHEVENGSEVFIVIGWNTNENLDEINIIESPCFVTESEAYSVLEQMQSQYPRSEWVVREFKVGQAEWPEGFVRTIY